MVGFPLGDEDAVGGGYFLLLDKGSELVTSELVGETVDELGTAGINNLIVATGLKVLKGSAPALEEHPENIVGKIKVYFATSSLDVVQGCRFKVQGAAALL